ncbi:cold shock domain-containing protein [Streptomyces sp. NPDC051907]|uniref:cold-shock protein n=1 Tax=Streptomyces sp. NPDC051907 TaxID=3155284 RepID=UPI00341DA1DD
MSEITPDHVFTGHVHVWHCEEGWGVLASPALPEMAWAHFSSIESSMAQADSGGFRELTAGQSVTFSAEEAEQDGYHWRALRVWPGPPTQRPRKRNERLGRRHPDGPPGTRGSHI